MKLNYSIKNKKAVTTSIIESCSPKDALFYISKEDVVSFETTYSDRYDFAAKIFKAENLKTSFKVQANTSDVLITNVSVDDEPYYYEVKVLDGTYITKDEITVNSNFTVIESNGKLYTNSVIVNYEIRDGIFIHSIPVVHPSNFTIKFYDSHISISVPKTRDEVLFVKTKNNSVAIATRISDYKIRLPSFYLFTRSKVNKIIEGDLVLHDKSEILPLEQNRLQPKDAVKQLKDVEGELGNNNVIYLKDSYLTKEERLVSYTAIFSSHIFEVDDVIYFKINNNELLEGTALDFDICIKRVVNLNNIKFYNNNFIDTNSYSLRPSDFGLDFKGNLHDNYKRSFTNYLTPSYYLNPSKQTYIKLDDKSISQEYFTDYLPNKKSKTEILPYISSDYSVSNILPSNEPDTKTVVGVQAFYVEV